MKRYAYAITLGVILCIMLVACDATPATPTITPTPTVVPSVVPSVTPTATPTSTQTRTVTPTFQPSATPTATTTPFGDLILHCFVDVSDDAMRQWDEPGIWCVVYLGTQDNPPVYHVLTSGAGGIAVVTMAPGTYTVILHDYQAWPGVRPDYRQALTVVIEDGGMDVLFVPFTGPAEPETPTATPTATPRPYYACSNYYVNCKLACDANQQVDYYGQCGAGLICCLPMATRTATP